MDKNYNDGYRDGFKDGFKDGYEAARRELLNDLDSFQKDMLKKIEDSENELLKRVTENQELLKKDGDWGTFGGDFDSQGFGETNGFGSQGFPPNPGFGSPDFLNGNLKKESFLDKLKSVVKGNKSDDYNPALDNIVDEYGVVDPGEIIPDDILMGEDTAWPDDDLFSENITFEYGTFDEEFGPVVDKSVVDDKKDEDKKSEE